jgi:hypothetical protein
VPLEKVRDHFKAIQDTPGLQVAASSEQFDLTVNTLKTALG